MLNQVARYEPVARLLTGATGASTVLEVGSGARGIARYLPARWEITVSDLDFTDYGSTDAGAAEVSRVQADVRDLPFSDGAFHVVLALDLLEHVPPADRKRALDELARVASSRLIVGCPCGEAAFVSDKRLAELYRRRYAGLPVWLEEHLGHGFPETDDVAAVLDRHGSLQLIRNESVPAHERIGRLEARPRLARASEALGGILAAAIRRGGITARAASILVAALRGWDRGPAYRTLFVVDVPDRPSSETGGGPSPYPRS
jgi:SAM-dependent methyltransferase